MASTKKQKPTLQQRRQILEIFLEVMTGSVDQVMEIYSEAINCSGELLDISWLKGMYDHFVGEVSIQFQERTGTTLRAEEKEGIDLLVRDFVFNRGIVWINMAAVADTLANCRLNSKKCRKLRKELSELEYL